MLYMCELWDVTGEWQADMVHYLSRDGGLLLHQEVALAGLGVGEEADGLSVVSVRLVEVRSGHTEGRVHLIPLDTTFDSQIPTTACP